MKLTGLPVSELLAAFRAADPTPGGGSAAALAAAAGASLLAMVAGLPKPKAVEPADLDRLKDAGIRCAALASRLEALIDGDSESYEAVMAAFRLPKGTDEEKTQRTAAIQQAMRGATEAPLQVMRHCEEALGTVPVVNALGNPNAASDAQVGVELLKAALRGARANVEINLGSLKDAGYVARVREEIERLSASA